MTRAITQTFSIERPVGEGETNRSSDLEGVRNALAARGLCRRSIAGQRDAKFKADLTAGVRLFQRKAGLAPDGLVIPGGPTALALASWGEVQAKALTPAQVSPDCLKLQSEILDVERRIADAEKKLIGLQKELDGLHSQRSGLRADLDRMLKRLSLGSVPSDNNLDRIFRRLANVPEEFRDEAQRVDSKTRELIKVVASIKDAMRSWGGEARKLTELDRTLKNLEARLPVVCG